MINSNYYATFIHLLLHVNYKIRKEAQLVFKKICNWQSSLSRPNLLFLLLAKIEETFESLHLLDNSENVNRLLQSTDAGIENGDSTSGSMKWPAVKGVYELINCMSTLKNLSQIDLKNIALKSLILINSPITKSFDPALYKRFLRKLVAQNLQLKTNVVELIKQQTTDFIHITTDKTILTQVSI